MRAALLALAAVLAFATGVPVAAACPSDWTSLPARVASQALEGPERFAEAAADVPAPFAEVAALVSDIRQWPRWVGVSGTGPFLREVKLDEATGHTVARVGDKPDDVFEGLVKSSSGAAACDLTVDVAGATGIGGVRFVVHAEPAPDCPDATRVSFRAEWSVTMLGRMFGGAKPAMIALLPIALRDDLLGYLLGDPARLAKVTGLVATREGGKLTLQELGPAQESTPEGQGPLAKGDELTCVRPSRVRVAADRLALVQRAQKKWARKGPGLDDFMAVLLQALDGPHSLAGCTVTARRGDKPLGAEVPLPEGTAGYQVVLQRTDKGASLGAGLSVAGD